MALDRAVLGALLGLAALTPLVLGAVHPWAYALAEAAIFVLAAAALGKLIISRSQGLAIPRQWAYLLAPAGGVIALAGLQCVPLPPAVLYYLDSFTYHLYAACLGGWPHAVPYAELLGLKPGTAARWSEAWRTLSIAPSLTAIALLKLLAYAALLFVVAFYPFGGPEAAAGERRFISACLLGIGCIAIAYAALGVLENLDWNGKVLWFIVPRDWGAPQLNQTRAVGPFVDPDHFGTYLVMTYPLLVAAIVSPRALVAEPGEAWLRAFFTVGLMVALVALALTMSRGSWLAAGVAVLVLAEVGIVPGGREGLWRRRFMLAGLAGLCVALLAFFVISGQQQVAAEQRLAPTALGVSLADRLQAWKATWLMWLKVPVFGVGLGAWQELFPHFQLPPQPLNQFREAHNDYLQILAEMGAVGFGLSGWLVWRGLHVLQKGWREPSQSLRVIYAGLLAGLAGAATQELLDFGLQIPANAILFAILLGLAARIAVANWRRRIPSAPSRASALVPGLLAASAFALAVLALLQNQRGFDGDTMPRTPAQAWRALMAFPTRARLHLALLNLPGVKLSAAQQLSELRLASYLDQDDPYLKDRYALALLESGATEHGFAVLSQSIYVAPRLQQHFYLSAANIGKLSPADRLAVAKGLARAVMAGFPGAIAGTADFYTALGRFADLGAFYKQLAEHEDDPRQRATYLAAAGEAYQEADQLSRAQAALRDAARIDRGDYRLWLALAVIELKRHDGAAALRLAEEGVAQGADATRLYWGLYQQADLHRERGLAGQALQKLIVFRPYDYDGLMALGYWNFNRQDFTQAAAYFQRACEVKPGSAQAWYSLGMAEERDFQYQDAGNAYKQALQVSPQDGQARSLYEQFERKLKLLATRPG